MKTALALVVALIAFLTPASAQVQYLRASGMANYDGSIPIQIDLCTLPPSAPVRVELSLDCDFYYGILNRGPAIPGYIYGQGINYTLHSIDGSATFQLCSNVCSGPMASGAFHESEVVLFDVPHGELTYVHTAAQIPTALSMESYGNMQTWPGFSTPWLLTPRARPWAIGNRNMGGITLKVTPL